jgi:TRAP-type C4-dicarboxylate transport system permease small subunit
MITLWRRIEWLLGALSGLALAALVLLPSLQVVLRDFFNSPIIGLEEATRWGLIILVFLAVPLLVGTNEHIRLSEFVDFLPSRARVALERVTLMVSGLSLAVICYAGILSVLRSVGTRTSTLDIPFWLFAAPMLVGLSLAAGGYIWFALRPAEPPRGGAPGV